MGYMRQDSAKFAQMGKNSLVFINYNFMRSFSVKQSSACPVASEEYSLL